MRPAAVVLPLALLATALASGTPAHAAPSPGLVVNEAYGGGGNSGATLTSDFVEVENRGSTTVPLDGLSVQYHSAGATGSWQVTPLSGTLAPGARHLVAEARGAGGTQELPSPQTTGTIAMSGTGGTVALVASTTALTCADSAACAAAAIDLVGYGTAVINETAPATGASNTASVQRLPTADTDANGTDFGAGAPTPGAANAVDGGGTGTGEPGPLRIHDLQGAGWKTSRPDEAVRNVPGVVTGVRASGSSRGFWIQDPAPDADPATSEGIFVFASAPTVTVGDSVLVSGTVKDFYPLSSGDSLSITSNLSVTEITTPTTIVLSRGNALPAPVPVGPATLPETYAPDLGGTTIEATPVTPARSALDFWESVEGMRVQVDDARVVGPSNDFGEQFVTTKPAQAASPRGATVLLGENRIPSGRVQVASLAGARPGVSVGDLFSGPTIGPVDYSQFGGYLIAASTLGTVRRQAPAPVVAARQDPGELAVATYNVENLAPADPAAKYERLARGIVTNLATPDVVALEEVQDDNGATNDAVVAAGATLTRLTDAIVAAGGPRYAWRAIDPVDDQDGGQPGGNIRVAFLFDPARTSFVDRGAAAGNRSTTGTAVTRRLLVVPQLTLSPGRIDPTNPVWAASRKPLVGEFRFRGRTVFVVANHFTSKGGDQNADGRFQFPAQSSTVQRAGQAKVVHDFVGRILRVNPLADVVVLGDINDFQFSRALALLRTGTADGSGRPILRDLITMLPPTQQYTYVFNGVAQVLDHILVTPGVGRPEYEVVHVNAEYADQVSDHDPQVVRLRP